LNFYTYCGLSANYIGLKRAHAARRKYRMQKIAKNSPSGHHRTTLSAYIFVRAMCGGPGGLPLGSSTHYKCCHNNATRAPIASPPNSAQLGGIPYHSPKLIRVRAIVCACGRGQTQTHRQTHTHTRVTTIYHVSSKAHATLARIRGPTCIQGPACISSAL